MIHQIGCKILGVNRSVNRAGVRAELGWKSLEGEIMVAKFKLLGHIELMEDPMTGGPKEFCRT